VKFFGDEIGLERAESLPVELDESVVVLRREGCQVNRETVSASWLAVRRTEA
jgi:hypothetical protein